MIKRNKILILVGITVTIFLFLVGYMLISDNKTQQTDTFTLSAQQFSELIEIYYNDTTKKAVLNYESLQDGNKVIIIDKIDYIQYMDHLDATNIEFKVNTTASAGGHISSITFDFTDDITDNYKINDLVKITFTIKHVTFSYNNWTYDCEVYLDGWDQDEYIKNNFFQILPKSCITRSD